MNKTIKIISILMIAILCLTVTLPVFATDTNKVLTQLETDLKSENTDVSDKTTGFSTMAAKVIRLIRNAAVIIAVVLISVLGIKYMMGSAEEKSGYQKSFIPLIVGIVVVLAAMQIATMLFGIAG